MMEIKKNMKHVIKILILIIHAINQYFGTYECINVESSVYSS